MRKLSLKFLLLLFAIGCWIYVFKIEKLFTVYPQNFHESSQFDVKAFRNSEDVDDQELSAILLKYWNSDPIDNVPDGEIPVSRLTAKSIANLPASGIGVIRFGHSTSLIKIDDQLWLLDPVFSERVSPFSFAGPKRFHAPPMSIAQLPKLTGVIISHDHYDHLDEQSITQLRDKVDNFVVPLGIKQKLVDWKVDERKVIELDWWQSFQVEGLEIVATPAQHFSGRGLFDRNSTLWASWVIKSDRQRLFYSGDTGYFDGFKQIGERYGPFDAALLEVGAYDELWSSIHMFPKEAVKANQDLRSKRLMPVHNSTFDMAFHPWYEPLEGVISAASALGVEVLTPKIGEPVILTSGKSSTHTEQWWVEVR